MRKFSVSLPVSAMIVNNFTTAKIVKKVCKTLFVTVTILSPNLFLNDFCFDVKTSSTLPYMANCAKVYSTSDVSAQLRKLDYALVGLTG